MGLRSGDKQVLLAPGKKPIFSVDFDWKEQRAYWVSLDEESIKWADRKDKYMGTLVRGQWNFLYLFLELFLTLFTEDMLHVIFSRVFLRSLLMTKDHKSIIFLTISRFEISGIIFGITQR